MQVERASSDALVENKLPDGSRVLLDPHSQRVFALNATAGAAWDACEAPASLSAITEEMHRSLDTAVPEEVAEEAVLRLQEQNLVKVRGASPATSSRREFITRLGVAAVPLVVAMTMTEQRAFASQAQSFINPDGPDGQCHHLPCDSWPSDPIKGKNPFGWNPPDPILTFPTDPKGPHH
ncbi:MAG: PqqD family protein [Acidobacteriaceae bacterium]